MTITLSWWLIPAALVVGALVLLWLGGRERGMLGGIFHGMLALALLATGAAFCLGRWLA